jgi:FAD-dependent urate hydroxylase
VGHSPICDVAIVGAGPYGLSLAAHLRDNDISFRVFGSPMDAWLTRMPLGMYLKSEACASSLSDPAGVSSLERFFRSHRMHYQSYGVPVPLDLFIRYGLDFQRSLVPNVENTKVIGLEQHDEGFHLRLETTELVRARNVVVAVGLTYFEQFPLTLRGLPAEYVTHSSRHTDLSVFRGREVVVVGGGQSALEAAALLSENGADVRVLVRRPAVAWNPLPDAGRRTFRQRVRRPPSGLGTGWRTFFFAEMPALFNHLPQELRVRVVDKALGPAGAWWLRGRVEGQVPILTGHMVSHAAIANGRVRLRVNQPDRNDGEIFADHVIAATGFRVNLESISFLDRSLLTRVRRVRYGPALASSF